MNPAPALSPVGPARIGQRPDQGRRRDAQHQFRQALDQREGGEPGAEPKAPAHPVATALQRRALPSRQEPHPQAHHVDVIA